MMNRNRVADIRAEFARKLAKNDFVIDKTGVKTVEIINASFIADEDCIFGTIDRDYVKRELEWYQSRSLNVNAIPGGAPKIWREVATKDGFINSNYGWCVFSEENHNQFNRVVEELCESPFSRRAAMIYIRPNMHTDYCKDGMSDFICTYATQYYIRDGKLHASVFMRSNDAVYGYKNDYAWQHYMHQTLLEMIIHQCDEVHSLGDLYWNVGSLHVYKRHFKLI